MLESSMFMDLLEAFCNKCYDNSKAKGFWDGPENDNLPTKVCLMHSELSEMLEAHRNGNPPCEKNIELLDGGEFRRITSVEEEVADVFIRLGDFCGRYGIDLGRAAIAKMEYNSKRPHMHGGKKV